MSISTKRSSYFEIPTKYLSLLDVCQTLNAVSKIENELSNKLINSLELQRVISPQMIHIHSGLTGREDKPFTKDSKELVFCNDFSKWNRCTLLRYGIKPSSGIFHISNTPIDLNFNNCLGTTLKHMNWERQIKRGQRFLSKLEEEVHLFMRFLYEVQRDLFRDYTGLGSLMSSKVLCITSQYLENLYPSLSPRERENEICAEVGTVFIERVGTTLDSETRHIDCEADIDDWNLNGVLVMHDTVKNRAQRVGTFGIRVDPKQFEEQCTQVGIDEKLKGEYHKLLMQDRLPMTMGAKIDLGIISMLLLKKAHIGEVQTGAWPNELIIECKQRGIHLL